MSLTEVSMENLTFSPKVVEPLREQVVGRSSDANRESGALAQAKARVRNDIS
jgi:hypothetical protein